MPSFLIEIPHPAEKTSCQKAVEIFLKSGSHYLTHCDWGCLDGIHKSWLTVETASKAEALQIVPPLFRVNAQVIQLNKFTLQQLESASS